MAIRYKFTFAATIVSALIVALFWGANIGVVYPVVEVVLQDQSMHQWIDGKIEHSQSVIKEKNEQLEELQKQLSNADERTTRRIQSKINDLES
jgi:ATP-binding cassette, subfamily B, bacterial MsbA